MRHLDALIKARNTIDRAHLYAPVYCLQTDDTAKDLVWTYMKCRACDIFSYGDNVANVTFPALGGTLFRRIKPDEFEQRVADMVSLLQDDRRSEEGEQDRRWHAAAVARAQSYIDRYYDDTLSETNRTPKWSEKKRPIAPTHLPPRVLGDSKIEALKEACIKELSEGKAEGWDVQATLGGIDELVRFCALLSQPENHIWVRTGQYKETVVNTRTEHDSSTRWRESYAI